MYSNKLDKPIYEPDKPIYEPDKPIYEPDKPIYEPDTTKISADKPIMTRPPSKPTPKK